MKPNIAFAAAGIAVSAALAHAQKPPADVVEAVPQIPNPVATSLMPIPIFAFSVHNVSFSPNGQWLTAGDGLGQVRIWSVPGRAELATIKAHEDWAFDVAWFPDGSKFATAGGDNFVHVFMMSALDRPSAVFGGHEKDVHAIVIPSDGRTLISAGDDRQIVVREADTGAVVRSWPAHDLQIPALALSPNDAVLASGSRDSSIRFWNPRSGELLDTLVGHTSDVMSLSFSPDGAVLASASYDQTVRMWDVQRGKALRIFQGHKERVYGVSFAPDGSRVASVGGNTLRLWSWPEGTLLKQVAFNSQIKFVDGLVGEHISSVTFSPDGTLLAVGSTSGRVYLLRADGDFLRTL